MLHFMAFWSKKSRPNGGKYNEKRFPRNDIIQQKEPDSKYLALYYM